MKQAKENKGAGLSLKAKKKLEKALKKKIQDKGRELESEKAKEQKESFEKLIEETRD